MIDSGVAARLGARILAHRFGRGGRCVHQPLVLRHGGTGAVDALRRDGYDAILYHLGSAADRDHFFGRMPLARRVDGILALSRPPTTRSVTRSG